MAFAELKVLVESLWKKLTEFPVLLSPLLEKRLGRVVDSTMCREGTWEIGTKWRKQTMIRFLEVRFWLNFRSVKCLPLFSISIKIANIL